MGNPKRPRDTNQLAKFIVGLATGEEKESDVNGNKNPAAVELGRLGGLKGGKARAEKLTAKKRSEIAKKAAKKDGVYEKHRFLPLKFRPSFEGLKKKGYFCIQ